MRFFLGGPEEDSVPAFFYFLEASDLSGFWVCRDAHPSQGAVPGPPHPHTILPLCVCVPNPSSYEDASHWMEGSA